MAKVKEPSVTYIVDKKGKKTAVILPIERYEELLEDLAVIASRKHEPTYDWEDLKKKLKKNGILSDKA